jgi:hypothetical protein
MSHIEVEELSDQSINQSKVGVMVPYRHLPLGQVVIMTMTPHSLIKHRNCKTELHNCHPESRPISPRLSSGREYSYHSRTFIPKSCPPNTHSPTISSQLKLTLSEAHD